MLSRCRRTDERGSVALAVIRASALAATDAALAATSARIAIESASFNTSGTTGSSTWTAVATKVDATSWNVHVVGTASSSVRVIDASFVQRNGSGWVVANWHEVGG